MASWGLPPPLRLLQRPPCQELRHPLHTVLPLLPQEDVVMSQTIRTAGVVRATLLSAWLKRAKVSGERGVQTANLPSLFYLLTSASCQQLSKAPSSDACCSSGFSLQKTGSCLGDQHVRQEPLAFHWVVLWKRNGWQQKITTETKINREIMNT